MDEFEKNTKETIRNQVERFKKLGLSDLDIVRWVEDFGKYVPLANHFETIEELASFTQLPFHHFKETWD